MNLKETFRLIDTTNRRLTNLNEKLKIIEKDFELIADGLGKTMLKEEELKDVCIGEASRKIIEETVDTQVKQYVSTRLSTVEYNIKGFEQAMWQSLKNMETQINKTKEVKKIKEKKVKKNKEK